MSSLFLKKALLAAFLCCWGASCLHAETLAQQTARLEEIPLNGGVNRLRVEGRDVLIVKGAFNLETAWGGDVYSLLVHDEEGATSNSWKMVRYDSAPWNNMLVQTTPHTGEDSLHIVRFMAPLKNAPSELQALYLLEGRRPSKPGAKVNESPVTLTLFKLRRDDDFGIFYLTKVAQMQTKTPFCNIESAFKKELGLPFPENDDAAYACPQSHKSAPIAP